MTRIFMAARTRTYAAALLLTATLFFLPGCASDSAATSDDRELKLVEHPNPMGGPSTYIYR